MVFDRGVRLVQTELNQSLVQMLYLCHALCVLLPAVQRCNKADLISAISRHHVFHLGDFLLLCVCVCIHRHWKIVLP